MVCLLAVFLSDHDLCNIQLSIQLPNGILNQLLRIKGYCIDGFVVDSVPKRKKFFLFQLLWIEMRLHIAAVGVLRENAAAIENRGEHAHDRRCTVLHLRGHLHGSVLLVRVILVGQFSATDIAVLNQILINGVRQFFRDAHRFAVCILQIFPQEQLWLDLARPVGQNFG